MNQLNRFEEKDIEYEHPLIPADPSSNQDGSVIGVPEVTNTSSTTEEEQREDGSVNEVPELTNASNTTGEEQIETDYVTLTTESATPNITGEEANENDSMILPAELVPSSTTEMEPGESVEVFKDTGVIHDTDIHSDGRHTAHNSQEDNRTEMSEFHDIEKKSSTAKDEKVKEKNQLNLLPEEERRYIELCISEHSKENEIFSVDSNKDLLGKYASELSKVENTSMAGDKNLKETNQAYKSNQDLISELNDIEKKTSTDAKTLLAKDEKMKKRNQDGEASKLIYENLLLLARKASKLIYVIVLLLRKNLAMKIYKLDRLQTSFVYPQTTKDGEASKLIYENLLLLLYIQEVSNYGINYLSLYQLYIHEVSNNFINYLSHYQLYIQEVSNNFINYLSHYQLHIQEVSNNFMYYISHQLDVWLQRTNNIFAYSEHYQFDAWLPETNNIISYSLYYQGIAIFQAKCRECRDGKSASIYIRMDSEYKVATKDLKQSGQISAGINVYTSVIRNESYRMMESIDMIQSKAMKMLGPERTQIFLDLWADKLPIFRSALAIRGFVPNMAQSAIRDQVISFPEHFSVVMNQIMTSLSSCPDGERLQQMPEPVFRALLEIIIEFSLESKSYKAKGLCSKGKRLIVYDVQQFVETLGEKIPEELLNRFNPGHEVVVYRFGDKNKRSQPPEKRENMLIHSIYSPSDCRLFIHIPTEKGSYWHKLEMQTAIASK